MLMFAGLLSILDCQPIFHKENSAALTVISLTSIKPAAEVILAKPHALAGPLPKPTPPVMADSLTRAAAQLQFEPLPTVPRSQIETGQLPAVAGSRLEGEPQNIVIVTSPDTALKEYQSTIWRMIDANRPRGVNMQGMVTIVFRLSADGALLSLGVSRTSGNMLLDRIALRSVRQAAPFPHPPAGLSGSAMTFEIPINFH